jgi:hypothetical protein
MRPMFYYQSIWTLGFLAIGAGCTSDMPSAGKTGGGGSFGSGGQSAQSLPTGGTAGGPINFDTTASSRDAGTEEAGICKTEQVVATIVPTRLAFAFDVSGSMGEGDFPWHDKTLKWDPVVAATKGFFADRNSQGIEASLVFFPIGDDTIKCLSNTYATPNVPMTALPSTAFGAAIDRQTPDGDGTPSVEVIEGTLSYLRAQRAAKPGKYVLVLATDGSPALCGSVNSIENAAKIVAVARTEGFSTYVIGVKNPPITDAPDVTSNLSQIASAGGTTVFFLDTGSPIVTQRALASAIDQIRGASITCDIAIPNPPVGRTFDKKKVILTYTSGTSSPLVLTYDAACTGTSGWHYDDLTKPTRVLLCPSICSTIQADAKAVLNMGFACEEVISVIP